MSFWRRLFRKQGSPSVQNQGAVMPRTISPHPKNVAGPFYVEHGCCTACDLPMQEAPGMFSYDDHHCFVCRQPETNDEYTAMIGTAWMAEFQCIRYRGSDSEVLRRMAELDRGHLCDHPPPKQILPVIRNHVQFTVNGDPPITSPQQLADEFQKYLISLNTEWRQFQIKPIRATESEASLDFAWFEQNFHTVVLDTIPGTASDWHIESVLQNALGDRGAANIVSGWLIRNPSRFCNVKWFSEIDWHGSKQWQATLW